MTADATAPTGVQFQDAPPTVASRRTGPSGFAGWRILAVAIVTATFTGPGQTIGVSVFIDPMVDALGVSRSAVSGAYLFGTLLGASAMPFVGRFVDRRGIRVAQVLVGMAFAAALVGMAGVRSLVWLAVGFAGIRMMGQGALSMISVVTVSLWFERRRGLAMGLLATVGGAGIVAVPVVLDAVISATSWRVAWLVAGAAILAVVVPLGWFGLIDRPADIGQAPDGVPRRTPRSGSASGDPRSGSASGDGRSTAIVVRRSATRAEAMRTPQFWIIAAVSTVTGMLVTGLNFHQIDLLGEAGLSSGEAAAMFLPQIVGSSLMGLGVGYVIDRVGVRWVPAFGVFLLIGVQLLGAAMRPGLVVVAYAVALGATGGAVRAATSTMLPGYFGVDHIGSLQGVMTVAGVAGSAVGPVTLAVAEASLGSYRAANLALLILPVLVLAFALTNRPLPPDQAIA